MVGSDTILRSFRGDVSRLRQISWLIEDENSGPLVHSLCTRLHILYRRRRKCLRTFSVIVLLMNTIDVRVYSMIELLLS